MKIMADVKVLEHSTLKVPYEILNKKFRTAQKNIDREVSRVTLATAELESCLKTTTDVSQVTLLLDGVVEKLSALKRKACESTTEELDTAKLCKRRLDHLKNYESFPASVAASWKKKRLDRMLVEYFLRCGYYETALKLARHSDIKDLTNIDLFLVSKEVEESLACGETSKCLAWCSDNKSKLRKLKSTLEFSLREQEFIELIRSDQRLEAIRHARKYFSAVDDCQLHRVQKAMGLLACSKDTCIPQYQELLTADRWQLLVEQFRYENFKLHQLSSDSIFVVTLQAGLSALKTPHCYKDDDEAKNKNCPVCSTHLNELAKPLPYSHCAQSRLICYISGHPLNEHNPPMMLPNGFVYGYNALAEMAAINEGQVVCPRSKEIYGIDEAEKVFVM